MAIDVKQFQPKELKPLTPDRQMCSIRYSPCGNCLAAAGTDGTIRRWDTSVEPHTALSPIPGHNGWVQRILFHPDGKRLFSVDSWGALRCQPFADAEVKPLWEVKNAHDGWIRGLALSPDGKTLATCGMDQKIRLCSAEDGKETLLLPGHSEDTYCVEFSPDGKSVVSGDLKGIVKHWDVATGKLVRDLAAKELYFFERLQDVGGARCLAFDREGKILACGGGIPTTGGFVQGTATILFFDWESGKVKHTLKLGGTNDGYVFDMLFHPEGFVMGVSSGQPGQGKFFFHRPEDAQPFFLTPKMANCHSLTVHPKGTRFAVCATNANSAGNGRVLDRNKEYSGNYSPVHLWELPK